jgi:uncharacterized protein
MGFRVETDVMVPMRDGVTLATDLWIPDGEDPKPALLVRLPYGKNLFPSMPFMANTLFLLESGYCVVWQDCRGTSRSNGVFVPHRDDPSDGADTVEWIGRQSWCDGNVGMYGLSYLGMTQWATASEGAECLKAIVPAATTTDLYATPWYSPGGALSWHTVWTWSVQQSMMIARKNLAEGAGDLDTLIQLSGLLADAEEQLAKLPITDHPLLEKTAPWLANWVDHPERDELWEALAVVNHLDRVQIPVLHLAGWFDLFVDSACRTFTRMRTEAGTAEARQWQRLIIGPWDHLNQEGIYHDRSFGLTGSIYAADVNGTHLRFFDRHLRGDPAVDPGSPVRIFVMGINEWRDEPDWPLPDTQHVDYYLDSSGRANTASGDGALTTDIPTVETADTYQYDPHDPVPTLGGRIILAPPIGTGPVDQRRVEQRHDVLCFTTPVMDEPLEVTGHISLVLYVSSSALDTDFTGKLVDVFPDGRAFFLSEGVLRARYRNSLTTPELLEPGAVYQLTLDLSVTSNVFLPGHSIRLEVSSSNFPRYNRNTNSGGVIAQDGPGQVVVATNRVLHGPVHPSRLILPVIRR